jgi:hypothetical protein
MSEIVYVFTNPSMKELIKIGRTENVEKRLKKLSSPTGVPEPFLCLYAGVVDGCEED